MSDDFERAVLISFNFTPGEQELKARANSFISEIRQSPEVWGLCVERFSVTAYPEVKFWCLQTLHEVIRTSYAALADAAKGIIKTALMTWVTRDCNASQVPLPPFLRNKIAQTLVSVLQYEFPSTWPTFFEDLIRVMLPGCCAAVTPGGPMVLGPVAQGNEGVVDMFCRILVSVDEDLVTLDIPRSQNESKLSMHVKDSMREHSIVDVAAAWYSLAEAYATKAPELAAFVLQTMQRYICWIDINLVGNEKFTTLLQAVLESGYSPLMLRGAAADCLAELLAKRMEPTAKLSLIKSMGIMDRCAKWAVSGFPLPPGSPAAQALAGTGNPSASGLSLADEDPGGADLLAKLAHLLACLATETMDCLKKVENGVISLTAMGIGVDEDATQEASAAAASATQLLDTLLPALLSAFRSGIDEVSLPMLPFMSAYVARLKTLHKRHGGALPPECILHVRAMLAGIAVGARYPLHNSANDAGQGGVVAGPSGRGGPSPAAKDEQAEMDDKRRDLFTLYKNLAKVAYMEALGFVGSALQAVVEAGAVAGTDGQQTSQGARWQEVPAEQQSAALSALLQPLTAQIKANLPSSQPQGGIPQSGLILQALEAVVRLNKGFKTDMAIRSRPQIGAMFGSVVEVALAVPREFQGHKLLRARFISFVHRMVEGLQHVIQHSVMVFDPRPSRSQSHF
ncbi:armadillo-type protein [Dunaliella salina]|uniref:Exportin-T n=1 Tax=Dunaliella salina TaxID=3046 RepID=A0ABZ3LKM7_DUNSA|nr:armadillo-type protein [Dunaliella salina]|eukprot:KAF5841975.1 armadillo-type protein [Dunaliella salina]